MVPKKLRRKWFVKQMSFESQWKAEGVIEGESEGGDCDEVISFYSILSKILASALTFTSSTVLFWLKTSFAITLLQTHFKRRHTWATCISGRASSITSQQQQQQAVAARASQTALYNRRRTTPTCIRQSRGETPIKSETNRACRKLVWYSVIFSFSVLATSLKRSLCWLFLFVIKFREEVHLDMEMASAMFRSFLVSRLPIPSPFPFSANLSPFLFLFWYISSGNLQW